MSPDTADWPGVPRRATASEQRQGSRGQAKHGGDPHPRASQTRDVREQSPERPRGVRDGRGTARRRCGAQREAERLTLCVAYRLRRTQTTADRARGHLRCDRTAGGVRALYQLSSPSDVVPDEAFSKSEGLANLPALLLSIKFSNMGRVIRTCGAGVPGGNIGLSKSGQGPQAREQGEAIIPRFVESRLADTQFLRLCLSTRSGRLSAGRLRPFLLVSFLASLAPRRSLLSQQHRLLLPA